MKRLPLILLCVISLTLILCFTLIGKEKIQYAIAQTFYHKNYISVQSSPGKELRQEQFKPDDLLDITIDGKMNEDIWKKSQIANRFFTEGRTPDDEVVVNLLSDKEYIYLFWEIDNGSSLNANIMKNDSALYGDDYIQINLKPVIPDSIEYAREYSFSIAVNPEGTVWDAYYDPYHTGYFFTNWNSNSIVKTIKNNNSYMIEMAIPYAGLDIYSDPGWIWNLTFNRAKAAINSISSSMTGLSVVQNVKVRNPRMVGYYWPREDFWPDIIPSLKNIEKPSSEAAKLVTPPKKNNRRDNVWNNCKVMELAYDNKSTELLKEKSARARFGYDNNNIYFLLESPDPFPEEESETGDDAEGGGMKRQVQGLDGVYRDLSLETVKSFWITFQPSSENGDAVHQDFYFLTMDFTGRFTKIRFDSHGKPDKNWNPAIKYDIFKTDKNWGIELTIPVSNLHIPYNCGSKWRMNVFYNIPFEEGNTVEGFSKIQAWYPTLKDEKNPDKTGTVNSVNINYERFVKSTLEAEAQKLENNIKTLQGLSDEELKSFNSKLRSVRKGINSGNTEKVKYEMDLLDQETGIAEEKELYINSLDLPNDNYPVHNLCFINERKGFAVGAMGLILSTSDGGETWKKHEKLTDSSLSEIFFIDENEGWIAGGRIRSAETNETMSHDERGGDGIILHTTDGGVKWEIQFAKRGTYLFGIFFADRNHGWAVGEGGLLLRTENGGKLWSHIPTTGTIKWLNGIYFFDKLNGFLVGESETVLKTTDGGFTWEKTDAEADRKFYDFRSFYRDITFIGDKGWIAGQNGTILASKDRGMTWEPQATEFDEKLRELMDLRKIFFIDENNGYALGGLGTRIMKTDNGGESWSLLKVPNNDQLYSAWFNNKGYGLIAGARGNILKTTDNSKTWKKVNGIDKNLDLLIFSAHGDDSPIQHGFLMTYLSKIENKDIAAVHITRDTHSNEYKGEYYDYECDRSHHLMGVKTTMHFDEFDTGNSGATSFHINLRLWKGYDEVKRHMVAVIRAYRPDVVITHDPIYGEYDKPGHKVAGRSGFMAFYDSGEPDQYPELTRLGLKPYQPEKLYTYATPAFPATYKYESVLEIPLEGHGETVSEWANRALRCFQSQGIHFVRHTPLHLVKSYVEVPEKEKSIFDGLN